ncbi:hypothetical protein HHI36_016803 [Cryptolaemus montrouzieri]|uniref:Endonuclease/exonuclease/phosphatase domain-containing protein n=1 Tax=Cryptolaemus montrouzieri TaxID=559131 RepID=A0ABD2NL52_9CUCU
MEQRSPSNRLRFIGVGDIKDDDLTAGIVKILTTKMKMRPADIRIDYCFRTAGAGSKNLSDRNMMSPVIVRFSSTGDAGWGTGIFIRDGLKFDSIGLQLNLENTSIVIKTNDIMILFCDLYKPPGIGNRTLLCDIEDIVMASLPVAECVVVVGDFNVYFKKCDRTEYTAYINCLQNFGLTQLVEKPTRRDAIFDHIITNKPNIFEFAGIVDFHYSDHNLTKFTIPSRVFSTKQPLFSSYKDYRHFSLESFQSDIEASSMHKMFRMNSR